MLEDREPPEGVPPADEGIGLPTPPSPGRLPPLDLPPVTDPDDTASDAGRAPGVPEDKR